VNQGNASLHAASNINNAGARRVSFPRGDPGTAGGGGIVSGGIVSGDEVHANGIHGSGGIVSGEGQKFDRTRASSSVSQDARTPSQRLLIPRGRTGSTGSVTSAPHGLAQSITVTPPYTPTGGGIMNMNGGRKVNGVAVGGSTSTYQAPQIGGGTNTLTVL